MDEDDDGYVPPRGGLELAQKRMQKSGSAPGFGAYIRQGSRNGHFYFPRDPAFIGGLAQHGVNVAWAANKRLEISNFKFKFPRA